MRKQQGVNDMIISSGWDGERVEHAVQHLIEELGSEYNVSYDFTQETRRCGEEDGYVKHEIVPGSQKATLVILPNAPAVGTR